MQRIIYTKSRKEVRYLRIKNTCKLRRPGNSDYIIFGYSSSQNVEYVFIQNVNKIGNDSSNFGMINPITMIGEEKGCYSAEGRIYGLNSD